MYLVFLESYRRRSTAQQSQGLFIRVEAEMDFIYVNSSGLQISTIENSVEF